MQRGDVFDYEPVTSRRQPRLRLIVASQSLIDAGMPVLLCLPIVDEDPESLLAPRIGELGWAVATNLERTLVSRFTGQVGQATADEMEQVAIAIKAAMDLP